MWNITNIYIVYCLSLVKSIPSLGYNRFVYSVLTVVSKSDFLKSSVQNYHVICCSYIHF